MGFDSAKNVEIFSIYSSNILLDSNMKARISDFGLIRSTSSELTSKVSTQTTNPIGTSVYMSPEAYNGAVSYAMDVFSFGVVSTGILCIFLLICCYL